MDSKRGEPPLSGDLSEREAKRPKRTSTNVDRTRQMSSSGGLLAQLESFETEYADEDSPDVDPSYTESHPTAKATGKNRKPTGSAPSPKKSASQPRTFVKPSLGRQTKEVLLDEINNARKEAYLLKYAKARSQRNLDESRKDYRTLHNDYEKLQQEYRQLQKQSQHSKTDGGEIRDRLFDIMKDCQQWAKDYSVVKPCAELKEEEIENALQWLPQGKLSSSDMSSILSTFSQLKHGPYILLNTCLAHFLCFGVIARPFFFLGFEEGSLTIEEGSLTMEKAMEHFCLLFPTDYDARVSKWIGQTLDMLESQLTATTVASWLENNGTNVASYLRLVSVRSAIRNFIGGPATCFLRACETTDAIDRRYKELFGIIARAGKLGLNMWQKRLKLDCLSSSSMDLTKDGFQLNSDLMKPHHAMLIGAGNSAAEGQKITLVVQPAIIAYRPGDTFSRQRYKVWANAVVWVDGCGKFKGAHQQTAAITGCVGVSLTSGPNCSVDTSNVALSTDAGVSNPKILVEDQKERETNKDNRAPADAQLVGRDGRSLIEPPFRREPSATRKEQRYIGVCIPKEPVPVDPRPSEAFKGPKDASHSPAPNLERLAWAIRKVEAKSPAAETDPAPANMSHRPVENHPKKSTAVGNTRESDSNRSFENRKEAFLPKDKDTPQNPGTADPNPANTHSPKSRFTRKFATYRFDGAGFIKSDPSTWRLGIMRIASNL